MVLCGTRCRAFGSSLFTASLLHWICPIRVMFLLLLLFLPGICAPLDPEPLPGARAANLLGGDSSDLFDPNTEVAVIPNETPNSDIDTSVSDQDPPSVSEGLTVHFDLSRTLPLLEKRYAALNQDNNLPNADFEERSFEYKNVLFNRGFEKRSLDFNGGSRGLEKRSLGLEKRYTTVPLHECHHPLFYNCRDTVLCIYGAYVCDGQADCDGGDDEEGCLERECPEGDVKCGDTGACIGHARACNGCFDCPNGDDEKDCPANGTRCLGNQFYCRSESKCMPARWVCDGVGGQCAGDLDERCEILPNKDIYLTEERNETLVSFNMSRPGVVREEPEILVMTWSVHASHGYYLYASPVASGLGEVCGPSIAVLYEEGQKAANLCADIVPRWTIAAHNWVDGAFQVNFTFFGDFGEDMRRDFAMKFWQSLE